MQDHKSKKDIILTYFDEVDNRMTDFDSDTNTHSPYQIPKFSGLDNEASDDNFAKVHLFDRQS